MSLLKTLFGDPDLKKLKMLIQIYEVETGNHNFTKMIQQEIIIELIKLKKK